MRNIIIGIIITSLIIGVVWIVWWFETSFECVSSHEEQVIDMPMNVNVGGNKNGFGGVGIPIGNGKIRTKTVCDEYKKI